MTDTLLKALNPAQTIEENIPKLIELFVSFYGEEERETITKKLNDTIIIGYNSPNNVKKLLKQIRKAKTEELTKYFLESIKSIYPNHNLITIYQTFFKNKYTDLNDAPIKKYIDFLKGKTNNVNAFEAIQILDEIETLDNDIVLNIMLKSKKRLPLTEDEIKILKSGHHILRYVIPLFEKIQLEWDRQEELLKPYDEYLKQTENIKARLQKEYDERYKEEVRKLLPYYIPEEAYFNENFQNPAPIEAFSEENDTLLKDGEETIKKHIMEERLNYFNKIGLNLGEYYSRYDFYLNKSDLMPSNDIIKQINEIREKLKSMMKQRYLELLEDYQQNRIKINSHNLVNKDDGFTQNTYFQTNGSSIVANFAHTEDSYDLAPILYFQGGVRENWLDIFLIHELNHIIELSIIDINEENFSVICGWDSYSDKIYHSGEEINDIEIETEYEYFNEVINEMIAQELTELFHKSGCYVFNNPQNAKVGGHCSYESAFPLLRKFYETYKNEIIQSRRNNNMHIILETVGEENFNELNQIIKDFFSTECLRNISFEDKEKWTEEQSSFINMVTNRINKILNNMEAYSNESKVKHVL